jgi:hypothetical protein
MNRDVHLARFLLRGVDRSGRPIKGHELDSTAIEVQRNNVSQSVSDNQIRVGLAVRYRFQSSRAYVDIGDRMF